MIQFLRFSTMHFLFSAMIFMFISIITSPPLSLAETQDKITPKYVGSSACGGCHKKEYQSFMRYSKKARSFESIERVKKGLTEEDIKRCYLCHTTGYGKRGGFVSTEKTSHLKNAGCEVCHGPGELHLKTKSREDIKRHMTMEDCEGCHTSERVQSFRYKPMIHGGAH